MSKSLLLILCVLTGLLVLACAKSEETNRNLTPTPSNTPATLGPTTNRNGNGNDNTNTTIAAVGIAECDNFINAYETCVSTKVPEAARAALKTSVTTWRTEWKRLADNPQTRGTLAAACKRQAEATAQSMKAYNCTF